MFKYLNVSIKSIHISLEESKFDFNSILPKKARFRMFTKKMHMPLASTDEAKRRKKATIINTKNKKGRSLRF